MVKKIRIRQEQLEEAMDVFVNRMGTENSAQALIRTKKETEQQVGSNKDVNYVIPNDQMRESKTFSKSQLVEARRKYLKENSNQYTKESFIKK
jgi:hypothetical protein